ncbi:MAG: hypothetical protein WB562_10145 [Candidatus Sulfotelmatobacter sp.]
MYTSKAIALCVFLLSVFTVSCSRAGPPPPAVLTQQSAVTPSAWQQQVDTAMTKAANDPQAAPEMRANIVASQAEFDTLCHLDARLGTREARIYFDQEVERQQRIFNAMRRAAPSIPATH